MKHKTGSLSGKALARFLSFFMAVCLIAGTTTACNSNKTSLSDPSSTAKTKKPTASSNASSNSGDGSSDVSGEETPPTDGDDGEGGSTRTNSSSTVESDPAPGGNLNKFIPDFLSPVKLKNYSDAEEAVSKLGKNPASGDVDEYEIHKDGGMIYNPLSREAEKTGKLHKYDKAPMNTGSISLGGTTLTYKVPKNATAYDVIPFTYKLTGSAGKPVHVSVTGFEEEAKRKGQDLYDLNIPGKVDVKVDYLGSVGANFDSDKKAVNDPNFNDKQGAAYPPVKDQSNLTNSGTVAVNDITWLKFRYTNTGNTILDPEGNGSFCFEPILQRKNASGGYDTISSTVNLYERIFDYLYPGESGEMWVTFQTPNYTPGEYRVLLNGLVRNEQGSGPNWGQTIWGGYTATQSSFDFVVKSKSEQTAPNAVVTKTNELERNRWMHSYEEFMSSFDTWLSMDGPEESTMYIQLAPWNKELVAKLIIGDDQAVKTVKIPIQVESDSIKVNFNPNNSNYVVKSDGTRYPAVTAQLMADMRSNYQRGPDAAGTIINDLRDMQEAGINYLGSTVAFGYDFGTTANFGSASTEANKFAMDVARKMGFKMEGYSAYPYNQVINIANQITGGNLKGSSTGFGDPAHASANAILSSYSFKRYGDFFFQQGNGVIPITIEDSRGWLRVDLSNRAALGKTSLNNLRAFLNDAYGNIKNLNNAYGASYSGFKNIDPQADATVENGNYRYTNLDNVYRDWSKSVIDLDLYRSVERAQGYQKMLAETKVPNAKIKIRTEGANWLVSGINPQTTNQRYRHAFYSNYRVGMVPEVVQASGTVSAHADYITLPYTPTEVYELTKRSLAQGVIPMHMPQFNRMRDIAVNRKYGDVKYSTEYNLDSLCKGAYISTVSALFPWFEATYSAGGVPGILWQDYLCDGMTTATQFKEMKFFKQKLDEAMNTGAGKAWAKGAVPDQSWRSQSLGRYSYQESYIQQMVSDTPRNKIFG